MRRALGILIPAVALSVSAYWSLVLHWQACVMCWSERFIMLGALIGWWVDLPWVVLFAPLLGFAVASIQWWMQLRAVHSVFCSSTAPCDLSYLRFGPFTTAGLAVLAFLLLIVLAMDRFAHRTKQTQVIPFPRKAS